MSWSVRKQYLYSFMILKGFALNFLELLQQPISFLIFTKTHIFRRIVNNNTEENSKITLKF